MTQPRRYSPLPGPPSRRFSEAPEVVEQPLGGNLDARPLLVTGVGGFLGEHLSRYFLDSEWRVAGTYHSMPPALAGVEAFPFDMMDGSAWRRLLRDMRPAAIVHCAAQTSVPWCEEHPAEAGAANLEAVKTLCGIVGEHAPETPVVFFSTDLVFDGEHAPYGEGDGAKPLNVYGSLKSAAEEPVLALPRGTVIRPSLIYGPPASRRGSFLRWMVDTMRDGRPVDLFEDEFRTPVYVEDVAAAVELVLLVDPEQTAGKVFHAGGAERLSRTRMGQMVCEVFDVPYKLVRSALRGDAPGGHLRPRDVSLRSQRLLNLGWTQISFRDGLIQCRDQWEDLLPT